MVGRVGAGDDGRDVARAGGRNHRERGLPHAQQAHLAQVVEVVFVDHGEPRTMAVERVGPLRFRGREHRVEERNTISALAHARGRVQRSQRRIGLLRRPQLRIEPEEVRLPEEHVHRRRRSGAGGVGAGRGGPMCPPHGDTRASDLTIDVDRLPRRARPRKLHRTREAACRQFGPPLRIARQPDHRFAKAVGVDPIDLLDGVAAHFCKRGRASRHNRRAACHRFDDGQPEPFVHRWIHEHFCEAVERRQVLERDVAGEPDRVGNLRAPDDILEPAREPAVWTDAHELMRQFAGAAARRKRFHELRQVLPRLDGPDIENGAVRQAVSAPNAIELRRISDAVERRCGGLVHDVHPIRIQRVQPHDVVLCALGHGDDGVSTLRGEINERRIEQHAPQRVITGVHPQAHVVNRHDRRRRRCDRHHAVGEMRDIGVERVERRRRTELHPHHARHLSPGNSDSDRWRKRTGRLDIAIREHHHLVVRRFARKMMQQMLGVVPDTGPPRPQCGPVKRDTHGHVIAGRWSFVLGRRSSNVGVSLIAVRRPRVEC